MVLSKCRSRGIRQTTIGCILRQYATAPVHNPSRLRNMALVAHIDSGKTTLTESILLKSSYLSASGTVDTGSTATDFLPVERERGITVQSASIPVQWKKWTFNLIDTPGHADFGMEVESASRVVDGAVVLIDSVEGVEAQTRGVWRQLDRYGVGTRIIFLNKLDRPGASFRSSLQSLLKHRLHKNPMALTLPIASFNPQHYAEGEPGIQGLVDLVRWNVFKWDEEGRVSKHPLPRNIAELANFDVIPASHPISSHLVTARTRLLENLSMISESFMEVLLNLPSDPSAYLQVDNDVIINHLRKASLDGHILPVVCGAAMKHIGTELVMDYVGELLPSPVDVTHKAKVASSPSPAQLLAWKVNWDDKRGWMTFVRVYSGKVTRQSTLLNTNRNQREKVSKLLLLYASETQEVDELPFGSVGVILGLKYTRTGDTLVSSGASESFRSTLRDITPPPAVISASVIPRSHSDLQPVQNALESLTRTDPSLRVDVQEGQILVHGLGALHLEIVEGRLHDEWKVNFEFGRRYVSYREALGTLEPSPNWNVWETELGGKPVTLTAPLKVRAFEPHEKGDPVWDGNIVVDERGKPVPAPESMPGLPLAYAAEGILSALSNSPHSSLPMTHMHIQIDSLKNIGSKVPSLIIGAIATALRKRIRDAGFGPILEPSVSLKISVGESNLGKVVKDLTERGGQVLDLEDGNNTTEGSEDMEGYSDTGIYIPPDWLSPSGSPASLGRSRTSHVKRSIQAVAPLSQFLDYSNRLRSLSKGHGIFEMSNAGFEEVNEERKLQILREIGRA